MSGNLSSLSAGSNFGELSGAEDLCEHPCFLSTGNPSAATVKIKPHVIVFDLAKGKS